MLEAFVTKALANIANKAINENTAPDKWVIELIGSLNFLYIKTPHDTI